MATTLPCQTSETIANAGDTTRAAKERAAFPNSQGTESSRFPFPELGSNSQGTESSRFPFLELQRNAQRSPTPKEPSLRGSRGPGGTRTHTLRIKSPLLYRWSYRPVPRECRTHQRRRGTDLFLRESDSYGSGINLLGNVPAHRVYLIEWSVIPNSDIVRRETEPEVRIRYG